MTVSELKSIISSWPEAHLNGDPCEVWISNGAGLSSEAREVWPLNVQADVPGCLTYDMIICT